MDAPVFFDLVKSNFRYLVEECDFSVISEEKLPYFDNAEIVFQAVDCRIRVGLDRGDVYVQVSSISSPDYWYELATILAYLTEGRVRNWEYDLPSIIDHYDARIEKQVQGMAEILRPYCAQIRELSRQGILDQKRAELKDIRNNWARNGSTS
jgi:hypothetical protein